MVCDVVVPRVEHLTLHSLKRLFSTGEIHKDRQVRRSSWPMRGFNIAAQPKKCIQYHGPTSSWIPPRRKNMDMMMNCTHTISIDRS